MRFVIAGRMDCPQFVYASMIAQKLSERLPKFTYEKIAKKAGEWENWLLKTCKENEWYHMKSPIIWRELSMRKGKRSLIGDVTKFLDMCQDYYGLTRAMLTGEMLEKNEMEWFTQRSKVEYDEDVKMKAKAYLSYRCRQVCILGAANQTCDVLIMELLQIRQQNREHGMEIRLFDDHRRVKKLAAMAMDAKYCLGSSGLGCCRVAANLKEALYNVDLVIVMDSFPRRTNESIVMWLKRNRNAMCVLGLALNKHARKHCRVIIGGPSSQPNCYNANVLASFATKLHVRNIVVVTHDLGRETLGFLAKKTGMKLADFHCPPVWGFVGLNKYVDLRNTLVSYEYRVPGPRVSMQIPQGRNEQEIRTVDNMITDANINEIVVAVAERKCAPRLGRQPQLCKITAILDVLRFWGLKQEDGDGEVLSLGVYSDGTFNIPEGLYWSQPVTLEKGFWKPYARFPIPRTEINLQSLFLLGIAALRQTGVKIRKQHDPEPKKSQMRNLKKFNVDNIRKGIKVPPVRTKRECVQALRRLAKEELGIDFDAPVTPSVITEESETTTESVGKDQIFCECWRQELLQLKRMASELSSTTELEVDFSSNLSGSEFSIINPPEPYVEDESLGPCEESVTDSCEGIESSETIVVCDCGEECHCLRSREGEASHVAEPTDQKMVSYIGQDSSYSLINDIGVDGRTRPTKNVTFDPELSPCAGKPQKKFKLYGTKDAIVNEERLEQMRRRVRQYEDRELTGESDDTYRDDATETTSEFEYGSNKFHFSIDGQYEIVGDDAGLEALEEIQKFGLKDSEETFKEMWQDEVSPALQVLSIESETVSTSATRTETDQQTETAEVVSVEKVESERYSTPYLEMIPEDDEGSDNEEVVSAVRKADEGSEPAVIQVTEPTAPAPAAPSVPSVTEPSVPSVTEPSAAGSVTEGERKPDSKRRLEGIPKCCLCHCIVPEGEPGCHCGERRVVEVFRKESTEAVAESEDGASRVSRSSHGTEGSRSTRGTSGHRSEDVSARPSTRRSSRSNIPGEESPSALSDSDIDKGPAKMKPGKSVADGHGGPAGREFEFGEGETEDEDEEDSIIYDLEDDMEPLLPGQKDIFSLPPESFFPFSPKRVNKFMPSERPQEMTMGMPHDYEKVVEEVRDRTLMDWGEAEEEEIEGEREFSDTETYKKTLEYPLEEVHYMQEYRFINEISLGKLGAVEDWRATLMKRYKEWFESTEIRDDLYYDIAVEEVSDEEFEIDEELKEYFEN